MKRLFLSLFVLLIALSFLPGCSLSSQIAEREADGNSVVCVEAEGAAVASMFSGRTHAKFVSLPDKVPDWTKEEILEIVTSCFSGSEQAALMQAIKSLSE